MMRSGFRTILTLKDECVAYEDRSWFGSPWPPYGAAVYGKQATMLLVELNYGIGGSRARMDRRGPTK